jgi:hypothetical protein
LDLIVEEENRAFVYAGGNAHNAFRYYNNFKAMKPPIIKKSWHFTDVGAQRRRWHSGTGGPNGNKKVLQTERVREDDNVSTTHDEHSDATSTPEPGSDASTVEEGADVLPVALTGRSRRHAEGCMSGQVEMDGIPCETAGWTAQQLEDFGLMVASIRRMYSLSGKQDIS